MSLINQPRIIFGDEEIIPDLAAWRAPRAPKPSDELSTSIVPDWICEVLSPATEPQDRVDNLRTYGRSGVPYVWLIDPMRRTIELYELSTEKRWGLHGAYSGSTEAGRVRLAPFADVEIDLKLLLDT